MRSIYSAVLMSVFALTLSAAGAGEQLFNLPDTPKTPRFALSKERTWPSETGKPEVCLWDGDRYAAVSITIDDNMGPDHAWWRAITKELGFKVTWFVIVDRVGTGVQWGSWDAFEALRAEGHAVQSHTMTHLGGSDLPEWKGIEWEYADSQKEIEANMPGNRVLTMAYSGGKPSEGKHDFGIAAKYYIAGRGTVGTPNLANQINYMNTCSASTKRDYIDAILEGRSGIAWLNNDRYLRSWLCTHFHGVGKIQAETEEQLRYIKSREDDLWVGRFDEVVRYGMERDTHKLEGINSGSDSVTFNLTDRMDDTIYTIPLTVKLKLDADWKGARAEQGGREIACTTKEHDGALYALIQAVPDAGTVTVLPR